MTLEQITLQSPIQSPSIDDLENELNCAVNIRKHMRRAVSNGNVHLFKNLEAIDEMISDYKSQLVTVAIAS